jgi:hypothetical protein
MTSQRCAHFNLEIKSGLPFLGVAGGIPEDDGRRTMERLRAAFDEVVEVVKSALNGEPKSPVELLLDEHLPLDDEVLVALALKSRQATGIPTFVMTELASRTSNVVDCPVIQERIWEILIDHQQDPNLMKKVPSLL